MRINRILFVVTIIFVILNTTVTTSGQSHNGVTSITYNPKMPEQNENLTVTMSFSDVSNVSSITLIYCRVLPEYTCHIPAYNMKLKGNNYTTTFKVMENSSEVLGFHMTVRYNDNTEVDFPDERQLDYGLPIIEPVTGKFYYRVDVGYNDTTTQGSISSSTTDTYQHINDSNTNKSSFFIIPVIIALIIRKRRF